MTDEALTPVVQKTIDFYGDELTAVRADDNQVYVSVSQMCGALGIDSQAQTRRIRRHDILAEGFKGVANLATPGGRQTGYVLRVDLVPLWLSGIRASAVNEEVQPKLKRFQQEAAKVLWEAFQEGRLTTDPSFDDLLRTDTPAVQAYKAALAIMQLARNQVLIEGRIKAAEDQLGDLSDRLMQVEATLGDPGAHVTPDQAAQISQAVKSVALVMTKTSGTNQYGAVYGQLYREFGVTSYKQIPARRFDEVMKWLTDWHQSLVGAEPF